MNDLLRKIQPGVLVSILIFSLLFWVGDYFVLQFIQSIIFRLLLAALSCVLYLNILKLFFLELFSVHHTRATEILIYFLLYIVTVVAFFSIFFLDPIYVFNFGRVRYLMITFAGIMLAKFFFFMILGPVQDLIYQIKYRVLYTDTTYKPLVSVLIPAWNEEVGLVQTVQSLLKSSYKNLEIIVINDGSTDNSDKIMREFLLHRDTIGNTRIPIIYKYQENTGKGGALNHAISLARGDILISIDADCVVDMHAVAAAVTTFRDPKVMAIVGNVMIGNKKNSIGILQYLEYLFSFYFKRADSLLGSIYIIGGAAGAFRREVFEQLGGYNTNNITEDIELSVRIQDAGMKIEYVPDMIVHTEGAHDLQGLIAQRLRWKQGRFQTFYQHRKMFFSLQKKHNKVLTWGIFPLALLQEIQLLFELPFLIILYTYTVLNSEMTSILFAIMVVSSMFVVQLLFYTKHVNKFSFMLLAPIGWLLFYIATYVELVALLRTIGIFIRGKKITWQQWQRKGIADFYEYNEAGNTHIT